MVTDVPAEGNARPHDELGPELREAVEAVSQDEPPADWAEETLNKLRQRSSMPARRHWQRVATWLVLATAACLLIVVALNRTWSPRDGQDIVQQAPGREDKTPELALSDPREPTLWSYRQAAQQSPEELDELLDRHAGQLLRPSSEAKLAGLWEELL